MQDYPFIINPTWLSIFDPVLKSKNERAIAWTRRMLFPYIENNLHKFGVLLSVSNVQADNSRCEMEIPSIAGMGRGYNYRAMIDTPTITIEGSVIVHPEQRDRTHTFRGVSDDTVVDCKVDYEQQYKYATNPGWIEPNLFNPEQARSATMQRVLYTTYKVSVRFSRERSYHMITALESKKPFFLFTMQDDMTSVRDWIAQDAAKIPLTVTMLPWSEAVRLANKWHEDEDKKRQKQTLKKTPPGIRELVGKMRVDCWEDKHVDDYDIFWLKDQQSLEYESVLQHHCVRGYWPWVLDNKSLILHVRNVDPKKDTDRWTAELRAVRFESTGETKLMVVQFRGIQNCETPSHLKSTFSSLFYIPDPGTPVKEYHRLDYQLLIEQLDAMIAKPLDTRRL